MSLAERSQFADHLARAHLLGLHADRGAAFFVANALVQNLPDQTTEPVGDGTDGLRVSKTRDEPAVHDRKDRPLRLYGGVGGLIQHAAHLSIAFGAAVTVVDAGTLLIARARAHPGRELFR